MPDFPILFCPFLCAQLISSADTSGPSSHPPLWSHKTKMPFISPNKAVTNRIKVVEQKKALLNSRFEVGINENSETGENSKNVLGKKRMLSFFCLSSIILPRSVESKGKLKFAFPLTLLLQCVNMPFVFARKKNDEILERLTVLRPHCFISASLIYVRKPNSWVQVQRLKEKAQTTSEHLHCFGCVNFQGSFTFPSWWTKGVLIRNPILLPLLTHVVSK